MLQLAVQTGGCKKWNLIINTITIIKYAYRTSIDVNDNNYKSFDTYRFFVTKAIGDIINGHCDKNVFM